MFKSQEQVIAFINLTEKFILAVINNHNSPHVEDAVALNKHRGALEAFVMVACGISVASDTTDTYLCPDCGSEMKERRNRENGNKFYGCVKFPNCRGTRDENGLSRADREERKYKQEQVSQQAGFSFNREKRNPVTEVSPPKTSFNPFEK
jgi:predicted RNA-binding Zn-ribbon protein involved in translation (DUF1610 family)